MIRVVFYKKVELCDGRLPPLFLHRVVYVKDMTLLQLGWRIALDVNQEEGDLIEEVTYRVPEDEMQIVLEDDIIVAEYDEEWADIIDGYYKRDWTKVKP